MLPTEGAYRGAAREGAPVNGVGAVAGCPLCEGPGGELVWQGAAWRVVRVTDTPGFPGFYRLIWQAHRPELTDLTASERLRCIEAVAAVEGAIRRALSPRKINLAALGNVVPHLHWHLIARFDDDSHFPQPIWAEAVRTPGEAMLDRVRSALPTLDRAIAAALDALEPTST